MLIFEVMPAPPAILASQLRIPSMNGSASRAGYRYVIGKTLILEDSYMPVKLFP